MKGLATGERIDMNFGHPIDISDIKKMNDEGVAEVARRIQEEFDRLDAEAQAINTPTKPFILNSFVKNPFDSPCLSRGHLDLAL